MPENLAKATRDPAVDHDQRQHGTIGKERRSASRYGLRDRADVPRPSLRRGFSWLLLAEIASRALAVVTTVIVARLVGPVALGDYLVAVALLAYGTVIADAGLTVYAQREVVKAPQADQAASVITATLWVQLTTCAIAAAGIAVAALVLPISAGARAIALVGTPLLLAQALSLLYVVQAYERMQLVALLRFATQSAASAGGVAAVVITGQVMWMAISAWVALLLVDLLCWGALRRQQSAFMRIRFRCVWQTFRAGTPFLLNALLVTLLLNLDVLAIGVLSGSSEAGIYGSAYRIAVSVLALAAVVVTAIFPRLVKLSQDNFPDFELLLRRVITLSMRFTLPLTAVVLVGADAIVDTLFGSEYAGASNVLRVIFLWVPLGWISTMAGQALLAAGDYRSQVLVACGAVGVTVLLLSILVVPFGAEGAAAAVASAELATMIGFAVVVRKRLRIRLYPHIVSEWPYLAIPLVTIAAVRATIPDFTLPIGVMLAGAGLLVLEHRRRTPTLALLRGIR